MTEGSAAPSTTSSCHSPELALTVYLDHLCGLHVPGKRRHFPYSPKENKVNATVQRLSALGLTQPDIVYLNAASTHLMHLHGAGRNLGVWSESSTTTGQVDYHGLVNLEEWIVGDLIAYETAGALAIRFLSPMRVEQKRFHGPWRAWVDANLGKPMQECMRWIESVDSKILEPEKFCRDSAMTDVGSLALSTRLAHIVNNRSASTSYVDAYALTAAHPEATEDGRHYNPLYPAMIHDMLTKSLP